MLSSTYISIFRSVHRYGKLHNLDNNTVDQYLNYIQSFIENPKDISNCYCENHHILPKSWGGKDCSNWNGQTETENVIRMPFYDHVMVHMILSNLNDNSMKRAFFVIASRRPDLIYDLFTRDQAIKIIEEAKLKGIATNSKSVININTNQIFVSAREATRALQTKYKLNDNHISFRIKQKTKAADGCFYMKVQDMGDKDSKFWLSYFENISAEKLQYRQRTTAKSVINLHTKEIFESAAEATRNIQSKGYTCTISNVATAVNNLVRAVDKCFYMKVQDMDNKSTDYWLDYYIQLEIRNRETHHKRLGKKQIKCVETNKAYDSFKKASVDCEIYSDKISRIIDTDQSYKGLTFISL